MLCPKRARWQVLQQEWTNFFLQNILWTYFRMIESSSHHADAHIFIGSITRRPQGQEEKLVVLCDIGSAKQTVDFVKWHEFVIRVECYEAVETFSSIRRYDIFHPRAIAREVVRPYPTILRIFAQNKDTSKVTGESQGAFNDDLKDIMVSIKTLGVIKRFVDVVAVSIQVVNNSVLNLEMMSSPAR
ncbi:hypothetical protein OIDMADRAFT_35468 [Oidiodendron maius Zn]|uniref:Uncharacterized protein n=1 Tax=Oidiodendron maius (strain Zn) TaxID=913774 RepID=A0A0C3C440_OIDMZ|nr:hypothetical protein OIDMADRAFT_35468 [Oidiodendron maius Zn]